VVEVPSAAFDEPTIVTVTTLDPATLGIEYPTGLGLGAYLDIDFEGEANETLRIKVPAPEGIDPDAQVFVGAPIDLRWGHRLKLLSVGGVLTEGDPGEEQLFLSNDPSLQPEPVSDATKSVDMSRTCQQAQEEGESRCLVQTLLGELTTRSNAAFFHEEQSEWTLASGYTSDTYKELEVIYNAYSETWVYVPVPHDWSGKFLLPVLVNEPIRIVERDLSTGWIINEQEHSPISEEGMTELPFSEEKIAPMLIDASPFQIIRFQKPPTEVSQTLKLEIDASLTSQGVLRLHPSNGASLPEGTTLSVYDVEPARE
jgi:hypothetical protein